jgi:hypothetical protein
MGTLKTGTLNATIKATTILSSLLQVYKTIEGKVFCHWYKTDVQLDLGNGGNLIKKN